MRRFTGVISANVGLRLASVLTLYWRWALANFGHPVGTCKMGVDKLPTSTQVCECTDFSACARPTRR